MSRSTKIFIASVIVSASVVIQSTWAARWRMMDVCPDVVLTVILLISLILGPRHAALQGFWGGYLCGILAGKNLGSFILSRLFAGYFIGLAQKATVRENPLVAWAAVFVGTILAEGISFIVNPIFNVPSWGEIVLKEAVFNTLLALPLYPLFLRALRPRPRTDSARPVFDSFR
jgi:rod shape-determining protein MreD